MTKLAKELSLCGLIMVSVGSSISTWFLINVTIRKPLHMGIGIGLLLIGLPAYFLFSIRLAITDLKKTELFVNSLKHFLIGVSWGGHESLVFPAMTFDE